MAAHPDLLSITQAANHAIITAFQVHSNGHRVETRTRLLDVIRGTYPAFHVTDVQKSACSLFEYAAAGNAVLTLDTSDNAFNSTRKYKATGEGVEKRQQPGKLEDDYWFARFQYRWEGKEYLVYYAEWKDMLERPQYRFYILHPRMSGNENIVDGHCLETDELILAAGKWTSVLHEEIFVFDEGYWGKSKELWKSVKGASWEDVILDKDMKESLSADVQGFFDNRAVYEGLGVPWKRGVILHGVPGNGKTISIKALISALYARPDPIPTLYVKTLVAKGVPEQLSISRIFEHARKYVFPPPPSSTSNVNYIILMEYRHAPCLLVFEDLDSLIDDDTRSYFLNEVDGLASNNGILMIGSTNHLEKLDPAISKRPSRFDRKYHFKLPEEKERVAYCEYWRGKLAGKEVEFPEEVCGLVGKLTETFSYAYLQELWVMSLLSIARGFKSEEFEIADKADAGGTENGVTDAGESGKTADENGDGKEGEAKVCTCDTKCATCNLPKATATTSNSDATSPKTQAGEKKEKHVMPDVEIPEHLKGNLLLKVVRHQIRTLLEEMDNSKDEDESGKTGGEAAKKKKKKNACC